MQGRPDVVTGTDDRRPQRQRERASEQTNERQNKQKRRARANGEEWRAGGAVWLPGSCCVVAVAGHAISGDCGRGCAARRNDLLAILPGLSRPRRQGWRPGLHATCRATCPQRLHRDHARRIFGRGDNRRRPRRRQERLPAVLEDNADRTGHRRRYRIHSNFCCRVNIHSNKTRTTGKQTERKEERMRMLTWTMLAAFVAVLPAVGAKADMEAKPGSAQAGDWVKRMPVTPNPDKVVVPPGYKVGVFKAGL